jgi:hypothetical protein
MSAPLTLRRRWVRLRLRAECIADDIRTVLRHALAEAHRRLAAMTAPLSAITDRPPSPTEIERLRSHLADALADLAAARTRHADAQAEVARLERLAASDNPRALEALKAQLADAALKWSRSDGDEPAELATLKARVRELDTRNADASSAREKLRAARQEEEAAREAISTYSSDAGGHIGTEPAAEDAARAVLRAELLARIEQES